MICAGIVLFNPDISRLEQNIKSIVNQVDKVFLVDNASNNIRDVREIIGSIDIDENYTVVNETDQNVENSSKAFRDTVGAKIELMLNIENLGIATALNQLCKIAYDKNYSWILTLDQDTVCPEDIIHKMRAYTGMEGIGIICPAVLYEGIKKKTKGGKGNYYSIGTNSKKNNGIDKIFKSQNCEYVYACMTSASLTQIDAWKKVGGFREDYFIDFVDNEFCMKLAIYNYKIVRINNCTIRHQLGKSREKKLFGLIKVKFSSHAPWRFYYMIRNNCAFIKEYRNHLSEIKEYIKLWLIIISGIIASEEKRETLKYIAKGYSDARRGISGKLTH